MAALARFAVTGIVFVFDAGRLRIAATNVRRRISRLKFRGLSILWIILALYLMAQSFGERLTLVDVTTDGPLVGLPQKRLWVAAAKPDQAITLVLCAVPEGWAASLSEERLTPDEEAALNLRPGEVRELDGSHE